MYMLVLGAESTLLRYWGDGPVWPYEQGTDPKCSTNWWTNFLYVNNFVSMSDQVKLLCTKKCGGVGIGVSIIIFKKHFCVHGDADFETCENASSLVAE